jgi:ATP-dependent protease ClpP protease subunit
MEIPLNAPIIYFSFSADINQNTTENLITAMADCINKNVSKVYLLLSTTGGNVVNGLNVYNFLCGVPFELITHNVGNVDSIGNVVFLAGKKRYACPQATFTFHGVGYYIGQNQRLEENNLHEYLNNVLSDQKRIGAIICKHTKISISESEELFRSAQNKDVKFAIEKGIINEIKDVQIPTGTPTIPFIFSH